ncbi:MAG: RnfH family protein [Proteobacteria bacterium SW_6_67_9]|nr:MAG: RnfH family protein [Proteobacteria bacterium SW_6_67_9]
MRVEVAYARPDVQYLIAVELEAGDAVRASGLMQRCPEIDPETSPLGVFSQPCAPDQPLRPGDRVEVYRPLQVDPKEARRLRARSGQR